MSTDSRVDQIIICAETLIHSSQKTNPDPAITQFLDDPSHFFLQAYIHKDRIKFSNTIETSTASVFFLKVVPSTLTEENLMQSITVTSTTSTNELQLPYDNLYQQLSNIYTPLMKNANPKIQEMIKELEGELKGLSKKERIENSTNDNDIESLQGILYPSDEFEY